MRGKKKSTKAGTVDGALPKKLVRARDALGKLLDDKLGELRKARALGAESWDRQWEIVGEILEGDPPLWQGRYTSEAKFIAAELPGEDRRAVYRNVIVAGAFRPEDVETRGIVLLEEIALYVKEKSGMTERPRALDLRRVVVEVPRAGGIERIGGEEVELADVQAARRALGKKKPKKDGPRAAAVRKLLGGGKGLGKIAATIGEAHATFARVPLEKLAALGGVLARLKLPEG